MNMSHNPLLTTGEGQSRVLIPTITPLTPDGLLDEDSYCRYVRALFAAGVGGLYVNGSTGEGLHLEEPMRRRIAELAVELTQECNEADGDWRVCVIHVGAAQTSVALRLAEHAKSIGATCISSLPPFVGGTSFEEIVAYYERLAEFDVPILAYYIPMVTKIELTLAQLQSLAAVRNVIGFKFTSYNVELLMQLKARLRPEQQLYSGMDGVLVCGLMYGADGAIGAVYNIAPRQVVEVERRVRAGDLAGALEATIYSVAGCRLRCSSACRA